MRSMRTDAFDFPWFQRENVTISDKRETPSVSDNGEMPSHPTFDELNVGQVFYVKDCLYLKISSSFRHNNAWSVNDKKCCHLSGGKKIDCVPKCILSIE